MPEDRLFLSRILELSPNIVYVYDLQRNRTIYSNRAILAGLGFNTEEVKGMGLSFPPNVAHPDDAARFGDSDRQITEAKDGEIVSFEYRLRDAKGSWRWFLSHEAVFERDAVGRHVRKVGITEEITGRKIREDLLIEVARRDELTGLYNRRGFADAGVQHFALAERRKTPLSLLYRDLDDFKRINDTFGHAEGDIALKSAASLLRDTFRLSDVIARIGGDEFAVLLVDAPAACTDQLQSRFHAKVHDWNLATKNKWSLSFSVGCAAFDPTVPEGLENLLTRADENMYAHKKSSTRANEGCG